MLYKKITTSSVQKLIMMRSVVAGVEVDDDNLPVPK